MKAVLSEVETIVAEATPKGRGGVGVVRVSGPKVLEVAKRILGSVPKERTALFSKFLDKNDTVIDQGIALYFKGPNSFTGEDVLELHGHGGPVVMSHIIKTVLSLGARVARPGEFSERAFLNNKIDLLQAEAIADLINANSEQAARSAVRSLQGEFSRHIESLVELLIHLRMYVEGALDFPEEDIDFVKEAGIPEKLEALIQKVKIIETQAKQGALLSNGVKIVIAGKPNAGKSSLLNRLAGVETAIVTHIPGTTRDVLKENICLDGLLLQLIDTAGLRSSDDIVEQEGIRRAKLEMKHADHIIFVVDSNLEKIDLNEYPEFKDLLSSGIQITILYNKIDLQGKQMKVEQYKDHSVVYVSVKTGEGIPEFIDHLKERVGFKSTTESPFLARQRHLDAIFLAKKHLFNAQGLLENWSLELVAEEFRQAQLALDEITGKFTSNDLLGKIFGEFCIGK